MQIVYALIARGKTVLAEYTANSGNFPTVTRVLLDKLPRTNGRMSYVYDNYVFHYVVEDHITYLCMADDDTKQRRIPFLFLEAVQKEFQQQYGVQAQTAIAFAMNDEFQHVLRRLMDYYNTHPGTDPMTRVQSQLDTVKEVMVENIDKVLDRGEKFELLVDRTEKLNQQSVKFEHSSVQLRQSMWRRNMKLWGFSIALGLFVIYLVVSMACGFDFSSCTSNSSDDDFTIIHEEMKSIQQDVKQLRQEWEDTPEPMQVNEKEEKSKKSSVYDMTFE